LQLPDGCWDSHMHVIDTINYPLAPEARYLPESHLLEDALNKEEALGIPNIVLVQPSIYGYDNSCLLDVLRKLGPHRSRGVVVFDPDNIDQQTLQSWHKLGVRGVRVNFQSYGREVAEKELRSLLQKYANLIRPLDWVLQLYMPLSTMPMLESIISRLRIRVCIDHFGFPQSTDFLDTRRTDPYIMPGFESLIRLMNAGNTYVKISAPYRFCHDLELLGEMCKALFSSGRGERVVFGTDWPHTRHTGVDIALFLNFLLNFCGEDGNLINKIFRDNARILWSVV
jgi:predicted TIM-barrel fold metal-dependent hydrolase